MIKRTLGNSDITVAPLAFGGNVFGWTVDEQQSFTLLDAFVEQGFNFIDTANSYSRWVPGNKGGESETIIGNWVKSRNNRDKVIIATKVGSAMNSTSDIKDISRAAILREVEGSLKRLQTDYIDLYQTHWDDNITPVEETLEAYAQLIQQGKVRIIGASNLSPKRLQDSLDASERSELPRYQTFQPGYNLYSRKEFETGTQRICVENNISVITYYSLASGFLTGKYRSEADLNKSQRGGGIKQYLNERGFRILKALDEVAAQTNSKPAQVSLAWLLAQPGICAPIASATTLEQLNDLTASVDLQLSSQQLNLLNQASVY
ncbi:aldo/keto reductase [Pedobacter sp. BS3]|uniref:aldo/keto reductase n=1 Tax=Pedobacter sp. BS3 TaxID=2567937 RepID=UPI0011EC7022|nr:aldo/keto reductase [Pedobacter sp. BS3]TZF82701.1 aldo/keto reductase [Pedobacter sp. BS3]